MDDLLKRTEIIVDGHKIDFDAEVDFEEEEVNIDDFISNIMDGDEEEEELETVDVTTTGSKTVEIDLDEKHSLANRIVENSLDVIKNSKMLFTSFSDDVLHGKDRSTSSKETLIKALEVQNQANKNLIDLARTLDGEKSGNTNILIASSISPKKSGVDPNNIRNHFKNDR